MEDSGNNAEEGGNNAEEGSNNKETPPLLEPPPPAAGARTKRTPRTKPTPAAPPPAKPKAVSTKTTKATVAKTKAAATKGSRGKSKPTPAEAERNEPPTQHVSALIQVRQAWDIAPVQIYHVSSPRGIKCLGSERSNRLMMQLPEAVLQEFLLLKGEDIAGMDRVRLTQRVIQIMGAGQAGGSGAR